MRSLPLWLRVSIHAVFAALWIAGAWVFVLKHFFETPSEFGLAPHPWQPKILMIHGMIAVLATYLFGWISSRHVTDTWRRGVDRRSGIALIGLIALLIVSGFASFFFVDDSLRKWNGSIHEILGLALVVPWIVHLLYGRGRRRA
jgi:hypothetical protein